MAVATRELGLFINGETVEGSSSRELVEPATGEAFATAQLAGEAEIDRAVEAARAALDGDWGKTAPNERSRLLSTRWAFAGIGLTAAATRELRLTLGSMTGGG